MHVRVACSCTVLVNIPVRTYELLLFANLQINNDYLNSGAFKWLYRLRRVSDLHCITCVCYNVSESPLVNNCTRTVKTVRRRRPSFFFTDTQRNIEISRGIINISVVEFREII